MRRFSASTDILTPLLFFPLLLGPVGVNGGRVAAVNRHCRRVESFFSTTSWDHLSLPPTPNRDDFRLASVPVGVTDTRHHVHLVSYLNLLIPHPPSPRQARLETIAFAPVIGAS